MVKKLKMKKLLYILLLFTTSLFAQKVTTSIDSTKKKIGAEFKLTLKTDVDTFSKVKFPNGKFFGNLEVLESYKIDTIRKGNRYELIKKYVPKDIRPSKTESLKIDTKFSTYCKAIVWNGQKSMGKKITREKAIRSGLVSLSEYDYLGTNL